MNIKVITDLSQEYNPNPKPVKKVKEVKKRLKGVLTITKAKKKANTAFSIYIRTRDALYSTGEINSLICITCDKEYPAWGVGCAQAGHFIPGRHSAVLYDPRNAHGQCYNCNVNLKGNWVKYEAKMIQRYGQAVVDELKEKDTVNPHYKAQDYVDIENYFKQKTLELQKSS